MDNTCYCFFLDDLILVLKMTKAWKNVWTFFLKAGTCMYGLLISTKRKKKEKIPTSGVIHAEDRHGSGVFY